PDVALRDAGRYSLGSGAGGTAGPCAERVLLPPQWTRWGDVEAQPPGNRARAWRAHLPNAHGDRGRTREGARPGCRGAAPLPPAVRGRPSVRIAQSGARGTRLY